jgi:hypothetical protein
VCAAIVEITMSKLSIPYIRDRRTTVEIFPDELLDVEVEDVHDILQAEMAPLPSWLRIAVSEGLFLY